MVSEKPALPMLHGLPFLKIFQAFRMARQPSKIIIAFTAFALVCLAGRLLDLTRSVVVTPGDPGRTSELHVYLSDPHLVESYVATFAETGNRTGVFSTLWHFCSGEFHDALLALFAFDFEGFARHCGRYAAAILWALRWHPVYCLGFGLITLALMSVAGGAICRMAALQFAQGEKPGPGEALRFSLARFTAFFTAPLAPPAMIILLGLFIAIFGLLGNIPLAGQWILGISMFATLAVGAIIALFAVGTLGGAGLMFPAIAYDGVDSLDAISCSFHYVYTRPWRMGFYTVLAGIYGSVCYVFVRVLGFLTLWCTRSFIRVGFFARSSSGQVNKLAVLWPEPTFGNLAGLPVEATAGPSEVWAASLVNLFVLAVVGLVASYIISFYFSASTIIYALLRKTVDDTDLQDIFVPSDDIRIDSPGQALGGQDDPSADDEQMPDDFPSQAQ